MRYIGIWRFSFLSKSAEQLVAWKRFVFGLLKGQVYLCLVLEVDRVSGHKDNMILLVDDSIDTALIKLELCCLQVGTSVDTLSKILKT